MLKSCVLQVYTPPNWNILSYLLDSGEKNLFLESKVTIFQACHY